MVIRQILTKIVKYMNTNCKNKGKMRNGQRNKEDK